MEVTRPQRDYRYSHPSSVTLGMCAAKFPPSNTSSWYAEGQIDFPLRFGIGKKMVDINEM